MEPVFSMATFQHFYRRLALCKSWLLQHAGKKIGLGLSGLLLALSCFAEKKYEPTADFLVNPALPYSNVDVKLLAGDAAPDFTLPNSQGEKISLSDYKGKQHLLLLFYRGSWCPYCVSQLEDIQNILPRLAQHNVQLLAISKDRDKKSAALAKRFNQPYVFLSDRKLEVAEKYGIKRNMFLPHPALFLIDMQGTVKWFYANSDYKQRPSPSQIMRVVESLAENPA
ncbi:MAG: redoxin domain-containing protein [Pseudomonadales bacterium]|nr:redoxin domain-containing protein [Pseudomonadales bacterium]